MKRLTLEKIAELANTSRSAVSRVINEQNGVKPEVRERVLQVIEATNYQPNQAARSLASKRTGVIGIVIPRIVQSLFGDPYFPTLIQGIAQSCNANDYVPSLLLFYNKDEEQKLYRRVLHRGFVDGIIITASQVGDPLVPQLIEHEVPFIVIGRPDNTTQVNFVDVDNVAAGHTATAHLLRLGYKHVAHIAGPHNESPGIDRLEGYYNALSQREIAIEPTLVAQGDFTEEGGYFAMKQLLLLRPEAVFAASDMMAFGAMRAIRENGLRIPQDIALVGFDDLPAAAIATPPLTTIRQPIRRIGTLAVETLVDILENGLYPNRNTILGTQLIVRDSCSPNLETT